MLSKLKLGVASMVVPVKTLDNMDFLVQVGQAVDKGAVVGIKFAGIVELDLAKQLNVKMGEVDKYLQKKIGDAVSEGEILGAKKSVFKTKRILNHVQGEVIAINDGKMQIKLAQPDEKFISPMKGVVKEIENNWLRLEVTGESLEGTWGWGPLVWGEIKTLGFVKSELGEKQSLSLEEVRGNLQGVIVVLRGELSQALWYKLCAMGIKGLVCSQISSDFDSWRELQHDAVERSVIVLGDSDHPFAESAWEWFNSMVGKIGVLDGEEKKILVVHNV